MVQKYLCKTGGRFYVVYVDSKEAFDSLDHHKVFTLLNEKGIQGKFFTVLMSMYFNLKAQVKINNKLTSSINCNIGLKQGDSTFTTIFNIYINSLYSLIKERCERGRFITNEIGIISTFVCLGFYAVSTVH